MKKIEPYNSAVYKSEEELQCMICFKNTNHLVEFYNEATNSTLTVCAHRPKNPNDTDCLNEGLALMCSTKGKVSIRSIVYNTEGIRKDVLDQVNNESNKDELSRFLTIFDDLLDDYYEGMTAAGDEFLISTVEDAVTTCRNSAISKLMDK